MLSYRHGFHAGNFADVLKHSLLCLAVTELLKKDKALAYIDTHSGAGMYSLTAPFAEKTGEYRAGIGRLWHDDTAPSLLQPYLHAIRAYNPDHQLRHYPGSPALVKALLRPGDLMQLSELHRNDFADLSTHFKATRHVQVAQEDGLQQLLKKLPPVSRRGLILIDPSYELKNDYITVVKTLTSAYRRFATGVYCLWYPVLRRSETEQLLNALAATGIRKQLRIEQCICQDNDATGMTGSGLLWINPPWQLAEQAQTILPWLQDKLGQHDGHWQVSWHVPE
ncbi:MAG: 23S rRNA (adenine(2030)-N(6))-methyltransferase RlmJ [Methylococcales bacterium]|nr:23S rRNA (adenine(2030)-N(6))-methyltransferase RlmJ [Methylococcales bacterium]